MRGAEVRGGVSLVAFLFFSPQSMDEMTWHHEMKPWEPVSWKLPRIPGFL